MEVDEAVAANLSARNSNVIIFKNDAKGLRKQRRTLT
jgi:hypothetical protein